MQCKHTVCADIHVNDVDDDGGIDDGPSTSGSVVSLSHRS